MALDRFNNIQLIDGHISFPWASLNGQEIAIVGSGTTLYSWLFY